MSNTRKTVHVKQRPSEKRAMAVSRGAPREDGGTHHHGQHRIDRANFPVSTKAQKFLFCSVLCPSQVNGFLPSAMLGNSKQVPIHSLVVREWVGGDVVGAREGRDRKLIANPVGEVDAEEASYCRGFVLQPLVNGEHDKCSGAHTHTNSRRTVLFLPTSQAKCLPVCVWAGVSGQQSWPGTGSVIF